MTDCNFIGNIGDVLPQSYFNPPDPPAVLPPDNELVPGISVAECTRPPTGDELIAHFHRIRDGVVPDCILRLADATTPLVGFRGDLESPYFDEFKPRLKQWLQYHGLDPADPKVLPLEVEFGDPWEQWINAITVEVTSVVSQ